MYLNCKAMQVRVCVPLFSINENVLYVLKMICVWEGPECGTHQDASASLLLNCTRVVLSE